MTRGFRITLWILSSLAVLWTLIALAGFFGMSGMMGCCGTMGGSMMGGGMMGESATMGMWMMGMMLHMTLTWVVMLGLVGVFAYLVATSRRSRRPPGQ
ncbi:MAG: hypothetical protein M3Q37_11335 [Gemmatimonadota bacterium]|nr:hypothetical protein [Gemmatimonadales bacterium]MDQ3209181.1 hypothetical protein [Gemmatimonadota bacterium]